MSDRDKKTPNTLATQFRMGSMNKMFTATAILQLAQTGKLKVTDSLGKYLADYPNQDVATKVTIHHLLTHTGGTGDFFGPEFDKHRLELKTLQDYVNSTGRAGRSSNRGASGIQQLRIFAVGIDRAEGFRAGLLRIRERAYFQTCGMTSSDSLPEEQRWRGDRSDTRNLTAARTGSRTRIRCRIAEHRRAAVYDRGGLAKVC